MMNNDLISRAALLELAHNHVGGTVDCNDIARFPAVDAEPVVYCKDCIHRGNDVECPMCTMEFTWDEDDGSDYYWIDRTADDGFCHCGAKMDAGVSE